MTVSELVQALLECNQPHAVVEVHGSVTCYESHEEAYHDQPYQQEVVGVHSRLNKVVVEVRS